MQRHAALNAAGKGRGLVAAEIDTRLLFQRKENATQLVRFRINALLSLHALAAGRWLANVRMLGDAPDFLRDPARRQDDIDKTSANGAARHGIELRALFTLGEGQSASRLDRAQTSRSVCARPGKDYTDRARAALFRQRFKKMIDREIELFCSANQF